MIQETSRIAYQNEILPALGEKQKLVYDVFMRGGSWTNSELSDFLHIPINTVTPRVFELRKMGLLCEHAKRRCKQTGRTAIAWKMNNGTLL